MNIKITPKALQGEIGAISSKSDVHRLLIASALSDSPTQIAVNGLSLDMRATIDCLISLGAEIDINSQENSHILTVTPIKIVPPHPTLNCRESGSTARFMLPVAACLCDSFTMIGEGGLPGRPFSPLCSEMERNGCSFSSHTMPMQVSGRLCGGTFRLMGDVSSQYITGLLLALPLLALDSHIELMSPLQSKNYVDMTLDTLNKFAIDAAQCSFGYSVLGGQEYISPKKITADGDWSNAAFWLACEAVTVTGLNQSSLQGDKSIAPLLAKLRNKSELLSIDVCQIPDLVPILAATAALSCGTTFITNAARLRLKESDRLSTVCETLKAIGADIKITGDGLEITGKKALKGGIADSFNDHRIAMALAIASCGCTNPLTITNAQAVNKSYPDFFTDFIKLGGIADVI